jgi:hypothetical protein
VAVVALTPGDRLGSDLQPAEEFEEVQGLRDVGATGRRR